MVLYLFLWSDIFHQNAIPQRIHMEERYPTMNKNSIYSTVLLTSLAVAPFTLSAQAENRYVVLGAETSEILALFDAKKDIVGVGRMATYPRDLQKNSPVVGYIHQTPAESILAVKPTHVVATSLLGPKKTVTTLKSTGINLLQTTYTKSPADISKNIRAIGTFVGEADKAEKIATAVAEDFKAIGGITGNLKPVKYALMSYNRGRLVASGSGSSVMTLAWAKGENVFQGVARNTEVQREKLVALDPHVIFVYKYTMRSLTASGKTLADLPAIAATRAFKEGRVYLAPMALYSKGPRTPHTINALVGLLHGDDKKAQLSKRDYVDMPSIAFENAQK